MKTKLAALWETLQTSFWFVPATMIAIAVFLSYGIIYIDRHWVPSEWFLRSILYSGGVEGAGDILATIAGSAITVAGVIFSITMVALTLTTNQFGPRLLRNFMKDRGNQIVLGAFVATFIYCLLVSRTIQSEGNDTYFPRFAISFSIFLAVVDVGVLIYFIHHIASSIQADQVVNHVAEELHEAIDRLFPRVRDGASVAAPVPVPPSAFENSPGQVIAAMEGYLTGIDTDTLLHIARINDLLMQTHHRPGDFVFPTMPILSYTPDRAFDFDLDKAVRDAFVVEPHRAMRQDLAFPVSQLVEVAVRAVSPSINDPFTAMSCINRLGAALSILSRREFPPTQLFDSDGALRLIQATITFNDILESAFEQIRHYSRSNYDVQERLLRTLHMLAATADQEAHLEAIRRHAELIRTSVRKEIDDPEVQTAVDIRYRAVLVEVASRKNGRR